MTLPNRILKHGCHDEKDEHLNPKTMAPKLFQKMAEAVADLGAGSSGWRFRSMENIDCKRMKLKKRRIVVVDVGWRPDQE